MDTYRKLGFFTEERTQEKDEENQSQPKKMDEVLASILEDLEFAEASLQSTSHLLESPDNELEAYLNHEENVENLLANIDSISDEKDTKMEEYHDSGETNENITNVSEKESTNSSSEEDGNDSEAYDHFDESTEPLKDNTSNLPERHTKNESLTETKLQNPPALNHSEKVTELKIPLPSPNPYINFIQDFQAKYKGQEVTATMLVALAAARWRKMSKEEKQAYKIVGKGHGKKNKQVEKLRNVIKYFEMSEESLFQSSKF